MVVLSGRVSTPFCTLWCAHTVREVTQHITHTHTPPFDIDIDILREIPEQRLLPQNFSRHATNQSKSWTRNMRPENKNILNIKYFRGGTRYPTPEIPQDITPPSSVVSYTRIPYMFFNSKLSSHGSLDISTEEKVRNLRLSLYVRHPTEDIKLRTFRTNRDHV